MAISRVAEPSSYLASTTTKLGADAKLRALSLRGARVWQQPVEPRGIATLQRLECDVASRPLHSSVLPLLGRVLLRLRAAADEAREGEAAADEAAFPSTELTRMDLAARGVGLGTAAHGSEIYAVQASGVDAFILKAGHWEQLAREARHILWAASVLGFERVPRPLLEDAEADGDVGVLALQLLGLHKTSSLDDFLQLGSVHFALEDTRAAWAVVAAPWLGAELTAGARPPGTSCIQRFASQVAEILATLGQQPWPVTVQIQSSRAPANAAAAEGPDDVMGPLFDLIPLLERYVLQGRHFSTASPLHPGVRGLTEARYAAHFGGRLSDDVLARTQLLRTRLCDLRSAALRGAPTLPTTSVPLVTSHGGLTAAHVLLRTTGTGVLSCMTDEGGVNGEPDLAVTSWSRLGPAHLYSDFSTFLTSVAFEAARLPFFIDDLAALYALPGDVGAAPPAKICAAHLRVSEATAELLLQSTFPGAAARSAQDVEATQQLSELVARVQASGGESAERDAQQLLAWVRGSSLAIGRSAAEAKKISEALCDWTLPRRAVRRAAGARGQIPRLEPPPSRRQRGEVPPRAMQWGWQVVRDFRDAIACTLPVVEGDISILWPALWLVPSLRLSLSLLDSISCSWPQKLWLLYHIGSLTDGLLRWLDGIADKSSTTALQVRLTIDAWCRDAAPSAPTGS